MATSDMQAAQTALARNLLSSVLALALPESLAADAGAQRAFLEQQASLRAALERHHVFSCVTEGKALAKWQTKLLQLVELPPKATGAVRAAAWQMLCVAARQSPLERLEALAPKLLERVLKLLKQLQQAQQKQADEDSESNANAVAAACEVAQALLHHVERFGAEVRRDTLELLVKLLPVLVSTLSGNANSTQRHAALLRSQLSLVSTLLRVSPNALRTYTAKIEAASVVALFPSSSTIELQTDTDTVAEQAVECLSLLCNASDKPQAVWTQMAQKALEAAHAQLDLLAGKRSGAATGEGVAGKKVWLRESALGGQMPIYQRAEATLTRFARALSVVQELLSARTTAYTRGAISEREAQQLLPEMLTLVRRALSVRANEVGKHTGVSDDGVRLPISVVFAVLPRAHALALALLSAGVERTGLCALRHASKITRVLLLAAESVGDGEDLEALAKATAVCARRLGASTVEKLGAPLLVDLVTRGTRTLEDKPSGSTVGADAVAKALAAQNDGKSGGNKSKKRKRQAAAAATLAALTGGAADQPAFVSLHEQSVSGQSLAAVLEAVAVCVTVYGSLLSATSRSSASELALLATRRARKVRGGALDPVALALLADAVSADSSGAHAGNLLQGLQLWQRRAVGSGGASSALHLTALSVGEALLHPRAPPLSINFQEETKQAKRTAGSTATVRGDAMDWEDQEREEEEDVEMAEEKVEQTTVASAFAAPTPAKSQTHTVEEEEEEEEDYEDVRPEAPKTQEPMEVDEEKEEKKTSMSATTTAAAVAVEDEDEDDFPDIVADDADDE